MGLQMARHHPSAVQTMPPSRMPEPRYAADMDLTSVEDEEAEPQPWQPTDAA